MLMVRFAAGEDVAFRPLFALLAPRIRAFFCQSFSDDGLIDALTETTFVRLRRSRASYRPDRPYEAWVFGVAADVRREELRRHYGLPVDVGDAELAQAEAGLTAGAPVIETPRYPASEKEAARAAIARLPESQRVIVHLRSQEKLSFEQIAEILGATSETVRARACAAYQSLQAQLQTHLRSKGAPP